MNQNMGSSNYEPRGGMRTSDEEKTQGKYRGKQRRQGETNVGK